MSRPKSPVSGPPPVPLADADYVVTPGPRRPLDRALRELRPGSSWGDVRRAIETGKVRVDGELVVDPTTQVVEKSTIAIRVAAPRPPGPGMSHRVSILHADPQVVVVSKPAGIATVPFEDERDTLDRVVQSLLRKTARPGTSVAPVGVVQRLDKDTSGIIVFARTTAAKRHLQQQFRDHTVHRRYVALAHGNVQSRIMRSRLVTDRGDGLRGSTSNPRLGREAVTHVKVMEQLESAALIECALETGRTHQIRIHLAESGHPILGERVYVRDYSAPLVPAPRLMLHARELGFVHPGTGRDVDFSEPPPEDFQSVLERLRALRAAPRR
ncbi:MAG TPA: RluA family pseudouridine synthase [Polyangiaceae bacterium]|jgi:23S rRNA pseudouridine1911/1915/1917 synthase|nr:RluA family pseudouridine synthase [Polyangiaceae bacterium]